MAKFILTSRFIKNPAFANAGKLLQYMATRDGVEKLPRGIDNKPATKQQEKLINSITKKFPETKQSIEFEDYENAPTKIDLNDLQWYAAFHNTGHHPHIHLMVYSKSGQGYLTNKGIELLRSRFGNDIFRNEQYKLFEMQTEIRDELKGEARNVIEDLLAHIDSSITPSDELVDLFNQLNEAMKQHKGKWLYGYLQKPVKEIVDKIVHEIAKDPGIAALYAKWNEVNREKLSLYHEKKTPDIPLEDNIEFRSIKNDLLRLMKALSQLPVSEQITAANLSPGISGLIHKLAQLIAKNCMKRRAKLRSQVDSKLLSAIEEKKRAHGLKTERSAQNYDEDDDESFGMIM